MNGCTTCGGFGMHHDPIAHDWAHAWATCATCKGEQTIRRGQFDETCPDCGGDGGSEPDDRGFLTYDDNGRRVTR